MSVVVRRARTSDLEGILGLLQPYIRRGELLPREPIEVLESLAHWVVAVDDDQVIGCGSLVAYSRDLFEVRSLAVAPGHHRTGIGRALMQELMRVAGSLGVRRLFALTRAVPFFVQSGFSRIDIAEIPEKVWRDCAPCPFRDRCDEYPMMLTLPRQDTPGLRRSAVPRGEKPYATT